MIYLDTSVLLAYTLTRLAKPERVPATDVLFDHINRGDIKATTSFYALHEMWLFATNNSGDTEEGMTLAKQALVQVLQSKLHIAPLVTREERILHRPQFPNLRDASDMAHAISALSKGCTILVAYDHHFAEIEPLLSWRTPENALA